MFPLLIVMGNRRLRKPIVHSMQNDGIVWLLSARVEPLAQHHAILAKRIRYPHYA